MGKTKIFIRNPKTLFSIENRFMVKREQLATKLQARVKGFLKRKHFLAMRVAVIILAKHWRRKMAQKRLVALREAYDTIKLGMIRWIRRRQHAKAVIEKFVRGYKNRNKPRCPENAEFLDFVRYRWLLDLRYCLPRSILDRSWIQRVPPYLDQTSKLLRYMHKKYQAKRYRDSLAQQPRLKTQLVQKLAASELFAGKKGNYPNSVAMHFVSDRVEPVRFADHPARAAFDRCKQRSPDEQRVKYAINVTKFDRVSYKPREYIVVVTKAATYVLYPESLKLNVRIDHSSLLVGVR